MRKRPGHGVERRALARPVGADHHDEAARFDRQVEAPQSADLVGRAGVERLVHPAHFEQCHGQTLRAGRALGRFANALGSTRAANTKTAVISLRSLGSRPQRKARATISRNKQRSHDGPADRQAKPAGADERLPQDHAREPPDDHADAHLDVGEPLVLGEDRPRERHQAVGHHQADRDHPAHVRPERPDHPRVVAGGAHRRSQAGPEEQVHDPREECDQNHDRGEVDGVAKPDLASEHVEALGAAPHALGHTHEVAADRAGIEERDIASLHHVKVDRVEGGRDENAGEETVDVEPGVEDTGHPSRERAGDHRGERGAPGVVALGDERGGDRRAERQRAVGRDVRKGEDPEADEDAEREQRQDQPDGPGTDQQCHGGPVPAPVGQRDDPKGPAREGALAGADDRPRVAQQVQHVLDPARLEQELDRRRQLERSPGERPVRDHRRVEVSFELGGPGARERSDERREGGTRPARRHTDDQRGAAGMFRLRREREPVAGLGVCEHVEPAGHADRRSPEGRADQPRGLADQDHAHRVAFPLRERGLGKLAQRSGGVAGLPLRLEADHRRPFVHRESHAVEHVDFRNERAGRLLEIRLARPFAGTVGGDSGGREELAEAVAACLEAGPECSQADGDSPRRRPPGPIVGLVVTAVRKPGGVADQLEGLDSSRPATS